MQSSSGRQKDKGDKTSDSCPGKVKGQASLTEGSLGQAIWIMSWPLMLTTIAGSLVGIVDVQVAGFLGANMQAAVGLAEQVLFLFMIFIMSLSIGTTAMVSRFFGSKELTQAVETAAQSLLLSIFLGVTLSLISLLMAHLILPGFSSSPAVIEQGTMYLSIFSFYLIPFSIVSIINAAFRAIGDAKTPLVVVAVMTTLNVAGDYLTVFGNWPTPGLGIKGMAFSALVAGTVGSIIACWRLTLSPLSGSLFYLWPPNPSLLGRIIVIGIPAGLQRLGWAASVFALFFILSLCREPTPALASWTIGMRIEALLFMPLMALSLAVSSIVGQNLGARRVRRAYNAGWSVSLIGVVLMILMAFMLFLFAPQLAGMMSQDQKTVEYTISYLRINAVAEPFLALSMILSGALQGAADTRVPMWISLFSNWIVRLPLAYLLALAVGWGPTGAWAAMSVSVTVSAILIALRYQSKTWIQQTV